MFVSLPGVGNRAKRRDTSHSCQQRPSAASLEGAPFEVKEIVIREGPGSAIFPQHSVESTGSRQMG
jgi:hypothetical protein